MVRFQHLMLLSKSNKTCCSERRVLEKRVITYVCLCKKWKPVWNGFVPIQIETSEFTGCTWMRHKVPVGAHMFCCTKGCRFQSSLGAPECPLKNVKLRNEQTAEREKSSASVNNTVKTLIIVFNSTTVWVPILLVSVVVSRQRFTRWWKNVVGFVKCSF